MRHTLCLAATLAVCMTLLLQVQAHGEHAESRPVTSFSFAPPFYPESGLAAVPGYEVKGGTMVTSDFIRLTPDQGGRVGYLASRKPAYLQSWELTLQVRVHSDTGNNVGADGLALWMTEDPLTPGPVVGGPTTWKGLALVLDTFDNNGDGQNPSIALHHNDGTKVYNPGQDGGASTLIGSCKSEFRNQVLTYIHIYHEHGQTMVYHDPGAAGYWQLCGGPYNMKLPPRYYFTFSAATGGLSDNHEVYAFSVNTMDPPGTSNQPTSIQQEQQKLLAQKQQEAQAQAAQPATQTQPAAQTTQPAAQTTQPAAQTQPATQAPTTQQLQHQHAQEIQRMKEAHFKEKQQLMSELNRHKAAQPGEKQECPPVTDNAVLNELRNKQISMSQSVDRVNQNLELLKANQGGGGGDFAEIQRLVTEINNRPQTVDRSGDIIAQVNKINDRLSKIERSNEEQSRYLQTVEAGQRRVLEALTNKHVELGSVIERNTSLGFWTYFLFFQALFLIAFFWWRRVQQDNKNKLF